MKKQSIYTTFYNLSIILFSLFFIMFITITSFLSYLNFVESKKNINKNILNNKKELLKNEIDLLVSQIDSSLQMEQKKVKAEIKAKVLTAYNIANNLYQKNKNNPNIQELIKESLRELKFYDLGDQYVFMTKLDGTFILTPGLSHLEGQNVFNSQTQSNKNALHNIIKMVREKKQGYYKYQWQNHKTMEFETKISYIKYFEPFDCYIGTGVFDNDIKKNIKDTFIQNIENFKAFRDKSKYIFAATYDGISLTYPAKGKNVLNTTDINGKKVVQELIKTAKNGGGYVTYVLPFGKNKLQQKISYVQGIEQWNLYIGIGETLTEIDQEINNKREELLNSLYEDIILTIVLSIIILIVFLIIVRKLRSIVLLDIENIIKSIENLVNKNQQIDTDNLKFKEFDKIALQTNKLLEQKKVISKELQNKEAILNHQSKMAAMGEMLENIAHQWRQPLSVITTSTSAIQLKHELNMLNDKFLNESIESILENSEYLSHTIDDFRGFFQKEKEKEVFLLKDSIEKTLKLLQSKLKKQNLIVSSEDNNIEVKTYKNELIQVILVVLNNAKDALENLLDNEKLIFIKTFKDNEFAYIEIKDNAKGIKENIINKIFDPYFTTKHQSKGTGIGLYMAREIVTKHLEGEILAKNTQYIYNNQTYFGAKFTIKLPLKIN